MPKMITIDFESFPNALRINIARVLTDPKVLDAISDDPYEGVRCAVAFNKATGSETLTRLKESDPAGFVRDIAESSLIKAEQKN